MTKREEILALRKKLKELERFEEEEHKREFEEAREKELERDLRDLDLDEVVGDEELIPGKIGIKTDEIKHDFISEFDPFGEAWEEDLLAAQRKKQRVGYMPGGEELEIGDDVKSAKSVKVSKDELSEFGPFGQ